MSLIRIELRLKEITMRKLVLAASMALLTACAAPQQEQINFMPQPVLSNSDLSLIHI